MRPQPAAMVAAAIGLVGCAIGTAMAPLALAQAWLVAVETLLQLPLGAAAILMIHALTGGRWGVALTPQLRGLVGLMPLALVLFLPLLLLSDALFPFRQADPATLPDAVIAKLGYLSTGWLLLRWLGCAAGWLFMSLRIQANPLSKRNATLGLVGYALTVSVYTTDWMMALEPEFLSTIYAMMVAGAQILGALAAATAWHFYHHGGRNEPGGTETAVLSGDLAKLLLSAILAWVYLAYMQWLIIWMGNLPGEIGWYLRRGAGFWPVLTVVMILAFAALPFLAMLLRRVRNSAGAMLAVSLCILVGFLAEAVWRVGPAFGGGPASAALIACAILACAGLAGLAGPWLTRGAAIIRVTTHV